ncbi:hypothetical protein HPB47_024885 [Ixodes persulcatus]|uniref:Uncharacterized protein n=1 Tax=Ixodes persulcatus TaxID=34615 RepID=A0AC60Q359_IXOPE|nr:hypothetical protein HPB47_024885 [Ixodes persulcatus]
MKILEMKRKKMSATNSEKSEFELLQEKCERAERRVLVLEKEVRQLRQLNVNLQEIVIKKVESLMKGDERNCRCHFEAPLAPGAAPNHGAAQVVADDPCLVDFPAPAMSPPLAAAHALAPRPALGAVLPRVAAVPLAAAPALAGGPPLPLAPPQLPAAHAPAANLQPAALPAMQNAGMAANADDMVDIGKRVLIDRSAWVQAQAKRDTVFVKDVAVAMYGPKVLLESSVLGAD